MQGTYLMLKVLGAALLAITGLSLVGFVPTDRNVRLLLGVAATALVIGYVSWS